MSSWIFQVLVVLAISCSVVVAFQQPLFRHHSTNKKLGGYSPIVRLTATAIAMANVQQQQQEQQQEQPREPGHSLHHPSRRRHALAVLLGLGSSSFLGCRSSSTAAVAAETVGKDDDCNRSNCLGVWDGLLADCPHTNWGQNNFVGAGCVSSQDDTPAVFAEPWDYSDEIPTTPSSLLSSSFPETNESSSSNNNNNNDRKEPWEDQMPTLKAAILAVAKKRGDGVQILRQEGRYLRVLFTDAKTGEQSIGEFYFTLNDTTVQFRVSSFLGETARNIAAVTSTTTTTPSKTASTTTTTTTLTTTKTAFFRSSLSNRERCEQIRKELKYQKLVVLRNRNRSLFFLESDGWDTFGPSSNAGTALGTLPAEMIKGEVTSTASSPPPKDDIKKDPRLYKVDLLQQFPVQ